MPAAAASYDMLTGKSFDAETGRRLGLVTVVAPDTDVDPGPILNELRQSSRYQLKATKLLLTAPARAAIAAHGEQAVATSAQLFGSPGAWRNTAAFLSRAQQ